jgi:glycosyltransferase involved in cell wall biosynthesis
VKPLRSRSPLVSVVISCFNQERFIAAAIESAFANVPEPREVIVVDDGSTDESPDIIRSYEGLRSMRQQNAGVSSARNAGLRVAQGKFVVFLDGDDCLLPGGVDASLDVLSRRDDCMLVAGHYRFVDSNGLPVWTPPPYTLPSDPYMELLRCTNFGIPMLSAVLFRREVFDHVKPFARGVEGAADYDLYLRIARRFPICAHSVPVAAYRRHPDAMSRHGELMLRAIARVVQQQRPFLREREGLLLAYHEGCAHWGRYYGKRTLVALRSDLRHARFAKAAGGLKVLAVVAPRYVESVLRLRRRRRGLA